MGQGVHSDVEVRDVNSHGLFSHGRLVCVSGRLVVVREWNDGCAHAKNHGWVDFAMGPRLTIKAAVFDWLKVINIVIANSHFNKNKESYELP